VGAHGASQPKTVVSGPKVKQRDGAATWAEYIEVDNLRPACTEYIMDDSVESMIAEAEAKEGYLGSARSKTAKACLDPETRAKRRLPLLAKSRRLGVSILDPQLQPFRQAVEGVW
jgi:hypothetical protein